MIIPTKQAIALLRVTEYLDVDNVYSLQLTPLGAYYTQLNREQVLKLRAKLDDYLASAYHPETECKCPKCCHLRDCEGLGCGIPLDSFPACPKEGPAASTPEMVAAAATCEDCGAEGVVLKERFFNSESLGMCCVDRVKCLDRKARR